jgi:hypothetical protein
MFFKIRLSLFSVIACAVFVSPACADPWEPLLQDMTLNNEAVLLNAPLVWETKGSVVMGSSPRGDASPAYWTPSNLMYKSSAPWNVIAPWFVIYPGVGHDALAATNYRVKISKIKLYILKKSSQQWERINMDTDNPTWARNFEFDLKTSTAPMDALNSKKDPHEGTFSYVLDAESHPIHGGLGKFPIDGTDVAAVYGDVTSELILDDPKGPDHRDSAQLLVSIGADYYPDMTTTVADYDPMRYAPAVAISRYGLVGSLPRTHFFATIDPPGTHTFSEYEKKGGVSTISFQQFKDNPPMDVQRLPPASLKVR